nr:gdp-l-galactose phosphorylase 1 [Quercus suber]
MLPNQVVWQPYEAEFENLPPWCVAGRAVWTATMPLEFPELSPIPSLNLGIGPTPPHMQQEPPSHNTPTGPSSAIDPPLVEPEQAVGLLAVPEGRPKRISKAPPCGTGGHKHGHPKAEIDLLGDLIHPNLVKLIGFSIEDDQRLLVYEFLPGEVWRTIFSEGPRGKYKEMEDVADARESRQQRIIKYPVAFLDSLLLGEWEDRVQRGLFRYDVTACETKVIPGQHGFIAQLNEGRHLKKRPTEFRVDKVLQPFDGNKFNFTKVGQEEVLFQFEASEDGEVQFFPNAPVDVENAPSVVAINSY